MRTMHILSKMLFAIVVAGVSATVFAAPKPELPISDKLKKMWADPVLQEKIALGIENNRKGDFYLKFVNAKKRPVKVENLKVEMLSHDFLFGAQIFLLNGFDTPEKNREYEEHFLKIFNFATVPFYWAAYEQADGQWQFELDSSYKYLSRRPSQDKIVKFCKKNGLAMKGHPLSWYIGKYSVPEWIPRDEKVIEKYLCRYIDKVAERFGKDIQTWDVSNEASDTQDSSSANLYPRDHAFKAFKEAERVLPYNSQFIVNYTTPVWYRLARYHEFAQDYLMTSDLIARGAKVDAIGLQLHFFKREDRDFLANAEQWTPDNLFDVLDTFSRLNRPLHITEITFPCMGDGEVGEEKQAFYAENFYKLWFSHKSVEAITYWHFVDGAAGVENRFNGGFLRADFTPKKAYKVLDNLINNVWRTNLSFDGKNSEVHFRCFYGKYKVSFEVDGKKIEKTVTLNKNVRKRTFVDIE